MSGLPLRAEGLVRIYTGADMRFLALRGVSLEVREGEFAAIEGPSGSGKSTLLHLLAGLEKPNSGRVFIGDTLLTALSEDAAARFRRRHIGFVFQKFNLLEDLTVLENTALPLTILGVSIRERETRAMQLLGELHLERHASHHPSELSGGQQQRCAIARALIGNPRVIFADEPTGNLDSTAADEVMEILEREVRTRSTTLLMVTHDEKRAQRADRRIYIRDGQITKATPESMMQCIK